MVKSHRGEGLLSAWTPPCVATSSMSSNRVVEGVGELPEKRWAGADSARVGIPSVLTAAEFTEPSGQGEIDPS
ncbi:MAG: hypothetical protein L0G99_05620 [Propionibacteriales bacterium]|nr:hypothetical protein [Propionibacteriales bacterium]